MVVFAGFTKEQNQMHVFSPPLCLSPDSMRFLTPSTIFLYMLVIVSCLFLSCQNVSFTEAEVFFLHCSQMYPRYMKNVPDSQQAFNERLLNELLSEFVTYFCFLFCPVLTLIFCILFISIHLFNFYFCKYFIMYILTYSYRTSIHL